MSFAIPTLLDLLNQHAAIVGKTGSGKTSTAKLAVERIAGAGDRVCILDPIKSDWWGLTSSADGKRPGLPFHILGGPHGHVPLHSSAGTAIGELVATGALPLSIIDMADFEPGGLQRFFTDFAPALLKKMRGVLHLVIEEAHEFAPKERAGIGAESMTIHYTKKLATAGRSKGIRLIVATQRTQALHNAVLGSCETLIAHRLTAPADQKPILDWLKANAPPEARESVEQSLSKLPTGTGWVCSGEAGLYERVAFPRITTYDNSATPKTGDAQQQVATAPVDQDRLRSIIGEAVAEAEANDPKKLRERIAELEADRDHEQPGPGEAADAYKRGHDDGWAKGHKEGAEQGTKVARQTLASITRDLQRAGEGIRLALATCQHWALGAKEPAAVATEDAKDAGIAAQRLRDIEDGRDRLVAGPELKSRLYHDPDLPPFDPSKVSISIVPPGTDPPPAIHPTRQALAQLPGAARAILEVLASHHPARLTWSQIATLAGLKARGGHWNAGRTAVLRTGWLIEDAGQVWIAKDGLNRVGVKFSPPKTPDETLRMWVGKLPAPANAILAHLAGRGWMAPADIASHLNMKPHGGHWNAGLSTLRRNALVQFTDGLYRVSPIFEKSTQAA